MEERGGRELFRGAVVSPSFSLGGIAGEGNRTPVFGPRPSEETIIPMRKDIVEHA